MNASRVRGLALAKDEADGRLVVGDRLRVRHCTHRREPAGRRGARTGGDRLDVLPAWFPQVAVHVDESRGDDESRAVDDLEVVAVAGVSRAPEVLDLPV